jgi:hypothetical protein
VSGLRSALDEVRSVDLAELSDGALREHFAEVQGATEWLEAERLRCLGEIERRGACSEDGHLSTVSWLADRFLLPFSTASRDVRTATALQDMPGTRQALASGELSPSGAGILAEAHHASPEHFAQAEETLVEAAKGMSPGGLRKAVAYWRQKVDSDLALQEVGRSGRCGACTWGERWGGGPGGWTP